MTAAMDFSDNAISWYDRQFIEAKEKVRAMEDLFNEDPRFPDFLTLQAYLQKYPNLYLYLDNTMLKYSSTLLMPWGETVLRFDMAHTINGTTFSRPVIAQADAAGRIHLVLPGNSY